MSEIAVVKFGSNLVKNDEGLDTEAIFGYAEGLTKTYIEEGKSLIIVTSGAVAAGRHRAEEGMFSPAEIEKMTLQQFSSLGATAIFHAWEEGFEAEGVTAASVAVTHRQLGVGSIWQRLTNHQEKRTFAETLRDNAQMGIPTIINEADAISITELMELKCGGDNDGLASHIAIALGANSLVLFTEKGGIFDDNGDLIDQVNQRNHKQIMAMLKSRSVSALGRGGALTKDRAAWDAARAGVNTRIAAVNKDMTGEKVTSYVVE